MKIQISIFLHQKKILLRISKPYCNHPALIKKFGKMRTVRHIVLPDYFPILIKQIPSLIQLLKVRLIIFYNKYIKQQKQTKFLITSKPSINDQLIYNDFVRSGYLNLISNQYNNNENTI